METPATGKGRRWNGGCTRLREGFITTHQGRIDAGDEEAEARTNDEGDGDHHEAAKTT
jgi:hypothetical protein